MGHSTPFARREFWKRYKRMSFGIYERCPGPGFWERDNSHFPLPMSRHLWELFMPAYDAGTRRGLARYGSLIDHFDFARVKGRLYLKTCFVEDSAARAARIRASEEALEAKLWRRDRADWHKVREELSRRLLRFSEIDPARLDFTELPAHITSLRKILVEGTLRHFVQQPSSMFPVGDWVRNTCAWTGSTPAPVLALLRGSHAGSADFESLDDLDEYADRIVTGFDLMDLTLRELPQLRSGSVASWADARARRQSSTEPAGTEARMQERVPVEHRVEFDEALLEAKVAYGLHDEDVRITYLWPLGLLRRALVVREACDFKKLCKGDVLVAPTTSPAYNIILPMIGAVVTDRGGALSHSAIIAREFGIPAVVGTDQATSRIPDGARILVDGDRGFVAVRS